MTISNPHGRAGKFEDSDIKKIRRDIDDGFSCIMVAALYNCSRTTISKIAHGQSYKHVDPPKCTNLPTKGIAPGTHRKTTDEEHLQIVERFKKGESLRKIAKDFNVSHETVRKYGQQLYGKPLRPYSPRDQHSPIPHLTVISNDDYVSD